MRVSLSALALLSLPLTACNAPRTADLSVRSVPPGATVLVDGAPVGKTPARLELDVTDPDRPVRRIRVEMEGFEPAEGTVTCVSALEVMTPKGAAINVLCAPCCCGLPLLNLLEPVQRTRGFDPSELQFDLKRSGEGIALSVSPVATVLVDDVVVAQTLRKHIRLSPGLHQVEIRAEGYRSWRNLVEIKPGEYLALVVDLKRQGSAVVLQPAAGFGADAMVFDGETPLGCLKADAPSSFPLPPGRRTLRIRQGRLELVQDVMVEANQESVLDLEALARAQGPWLGATLDAEDGEVRITRLAPGGPAQKAGLQTGDRLLSLDGASLKGATLETLERLVFSRAPGDMVALSIGRGDPASPPIQARVTLERRNP